MNAVVVEAVDLLKATRAERRAHERHVAAIELAISVTQLPMGTAIIMQTDYLELKTDILVRAPSDQEYTVLARASGEDVVFANFAGAACSGEGQ